MLNINKQLGISRIEFTPAFYKRALQSYQQGNPKELIALMDAAELDSHISGCLIGRRAGFSRDWRVSPAPSMTATDIDIANFVTQIFMSVNMRKLFRDIHEALLKSFSVIELEWNIVNNMQVPVKVRKLNHRYFKIDPATDTVVINDGATFTPIEDGQALVVRSDDNPVLLSVLRDYILKEFGLESWSAFLETFGEAFLLGKYPPGSSKEFKDELESGINKLAQSSRGIAPEGTELTVVESGRNTGDHQAYVRNANTGISIAILGHENAVSTASSGLQVGENMSAYQVRREIAVDDMSFIEEAMFRLVKMIVDRNFTTLYYPVFSLDKTEPVNASERISIIDCAYEKGYRINPDEFAKLGLYKYQDQVPLEKEIVPLPSL